MAQVRLPKSVEAEIVAVGEYIALDDPVAAIAMMQRLYQRCASLDFLPKRGASYKGGLFRIFEEPYQIIYQVTGEEDEQVVDILTVHHMSRRTPKIR